MKTRVTEIALKAFVAALCLSVESRSQDIRPDSASWKQSVMATLTASQVSFTNWAQGGEGALSWTAGLDGKSIHDGYGYMWSNSYKCAYGQAKIGSQGTRKTDDRIELESILSHKMSLYVNPYVGVTFKTQFARGYSYDARGDARAVSALFDPGYVTESAGLGYQLIPEAKARLGAAVRETFTKSFPLYSDDPATVEVEKMRVEGGVESVTDVDWELDHNFVFKSKLELLFPWEHLVEVLVRMDNKLTTNVAKYVVVILNVQLIHEKRISPRTQVKETISLGLSYNLF